MSSLVGETAVVIGAGMGGLTAAAALSDYFARVVVLDRDELPVGPAQRPSIPQGRHAHGLLTGGLRALEELFPGFGNDLAAAGAVRLQAGLDIRIDRPGFDPFPRRDLGLRNYSMSRPLLESLARERVAGISNVTLRSPCRVREIILAAEGSSIQGVRVENSDSHPEMLTADLVVDASGRGIPTLACLKACGCKVPEESSIESNITYVTATFDIPDGATTDWKAVLVLPDPRSSCIFGFALPLEDDRWLVTVAEMHGDKPRGDLGGFMSAVQRLRTTTIYDAIRLAEHMGEIERFAFPASVRRHFERLGAFPSGLLPIADAICHFNPVYGQGMSVAAIEACKLKALLAGLTEHRDPLAELALQYFAAVTPVIDTPWDVANLDFVFPQTRGARPDDFAGILKFQSALIRLAARDPEIHKLMYEVQQLLRSRDVYREPAIRQRIEAEMASL